MSEIGKSSPFTTELRALPNLVFCIKWDKSFECSEIKSKCCRVVQSAAITFEVPRKFHGTFPLQTQG